MLDSELLARFLYQDGFLAYTYRDDLDFRRWHDDPNYRPRWTPPSPPPATPQSPAKPIEVRVERRGRHLVVTVDGRDRFRADIAEPRRPPIVKVDVRGRYADVRIAGVRNLTLVAMDASDDFFMDVRLIDRIDPPTQAVTIPFHPLGTESPGAAETQPLPDFIDAWNHLTPAERAAEAYEARVPPRERTPITLGWYYTDEMRELDQPPLLLTLLPGQEIVWLLGDLVRGETLSGLPLDRAEHAKAIVGQLLFEATLGEAFAAIGGPLRALGKGTKTELRSAQKLAHTGLGKNQASPGRLVEKAIPRRPPAFRFAVREYLPSLADKNRPIERHEVLQHLFLEVIGKYKGKRGRGYSAYNTVVELPHGIHKIVNRLQRREPRIGPRGGGHLYSREKLLKMSGNQIIQANLDILEEALLEAGVRKKDIDRVLWEVGEDVSELLAGLGPHAF